MTTAKKAVAKKAAPSKAKAEPKTAVVGHTIEVPDGALVERPNGDTATVVGGFYVVNEPGTYKVDGQELEVK